MRRKHERVVKANEMRRVSAEMARRISRYAQKQRISFVEATRRFARDAVMRDEKLGDGLRRIGKWRWRT